ncbi:Nucleotide-binding alpha-beta plait domain [Phytophthora cactorum]|nr:Nucleotide-binding alpha-beta plait domain [Phytophthora cactorum]
MADLDDEFARFEAEIQSLEQTKASDNDKNAEAKPGDVQPPSKKVKTGLAAPSKPEVVVAKPKIYMAPPRPAPVKKTETQDSAEVDDGRPDCSTHWKTWQRIEERSAGSHYSSMQPRVNMETGCVLPMEEQQMMNRQQSVYAYDPKRTAASIAAGSKDGARGTKPKRNLRLAGGEVWEDPTLEEWPDNDFRLFCGDLGNEVSDELLAHSFSQYASFQRARVVRDKLTHKSRGYGFVSFTDPFDCAKALREMNGKYIGNRPVKLSKSKWQERNIDRKRDKHHLFN